MPSNDVIGDGGDGDNAQVMIVNINEILKEHALESFNQFERVDLEKKLKTDLSKEKLTVELDTSTLGFHHCRPVWTNVHRSPKSMHSQTLFRSSFRNNTSEPLETTCKTERKTTMQTTFSVKQGLSTERGIEFNCELPENPCISAGLQVKKESEKTEERGTEIAHTEELCWGIDTTVSVKPYHVTTARMSIEEQDFRGSFCIRTNVNGSFKARLRKGDKELPPFNGRNLRNILGKKPGFKVDEASDGGGVYFETRGECRCTYAVDQIIDFTEEELPKSIS